MATSGESPSPSCIIRAAKFILLLLGSIVGVLGGGALEREGLPEKPKALPSSSPRAHTIFPSAAVTLLPTTLSKIHWKTFSGGLFPLLPRSGVRLTRFILECILEELASRARGDAQI